MTALERAQGQPDAERDRAPGRRASGRCANAATIRPTSRSCANCCLRWRMPRSSRRRPRIPRTSRSSASRIPPSPARPARKSRVTAQDGKHAVIVGKPIGEGNFARRSGENTQLSASSPAIIVRDASPRYWIDSRLLDVPAAPIQKHRGEACRQGAGYVIAPPEARRGRLCARAARPRAARLLTPRRSRPRPAPLSGLTRRGCGGGEGHRLRQVTRRRSSRLSDGNVITSRGTRRATSAGSRCKAARTPRSTRRPRIAPLRWQAIGTTPYSGRSNSCSYPRRAAAGRTPPPASRPRPKPAAGKPAPGLVARAFAGAVISATERRLRAAPRGADLRRLAARRAAHAFTPDRRACSRTAAR